MKNIIVTIIASTLFFAPISYAGNKPCSGKKGGIASCTADGKYVCNNGSISQSKKMCGSSASISSISKSTNKTKSTRKAKSASQKTNVTEAINPFNHK